MSKKTENQKIIAKSSTPSHSLSGSNKQRRGQVVELKEKKKCNVIFVLKRFSDRQGGRTLQLQVHLVLCRGMRHLLQEHRTEIV